MRVDTPLTTSPNNKPAGRLSHSLPGMGTMAGRFAKMVPDRISGAAPGGTPATRPASPAVLSLSMTASAPHVAPPAGTATAGRTGTVPAGPASADPPPAEKAAGGLGFHDVLSALNPLQYVPVIGTLYRSATGDTIPETTRMVGSLAFSGLTGGPIGIATSLVGAALEKLTGFDPEKLGHSLLAKLGIGRAGTAAPDTRSAAVPSADARTVASAPDAAAARAGQDGTVRALTQDQLRAYGVRRGRSGELERGGVSGADVLNGLELARLSAGRAAGSAYADVGRADRHA